MRDLETLDRLAQEQRSFYEDVSTVLQLDLSDDAFFGQTIATILVALPGASYKRLYAIVEFLVLLDQAGSIHGIHWRRDLAIGMTCHHDFVPRPIKRESQYV